ncbi:RNA polymerase ii mediator complex component [Colletotrichum truncatum]|uniref:RNA polymerase ii mediator complex component n=1 Tax=Colletotrichum truncatum TaxID=5467 RepID=A0ACC3YXU4_COLTU|nr:RNA polymerase ii mediator complex component [Colletotrichum truncatum]KAF6790932.1 RNA polymerase ii mediator complex component [Colletotrichum truncatum]
MLPESPRSSTQSASAAESPVYSSPRAHLRNVPGGRLPLPANADAAAGLHQTKGSIADPWFLEPSSWEIDFKAVGEDDRICYPDSGLDNFIAQMRSWLDQWTSENRCPFIHSRLYGSNIPSSLQHGLAAWQVYRAATTPTSERIALRMAESWSQNIVQEKALSDNLHNAGELPDLLEQLGRTQALLIFQVIGLFDGDVRARAKAEGLLSIVSRWANELLGIAGAQVSSDHLENPDELLNSPQIDRLRSCGTPASTWKAWILSESIRRLWIVATLTEAAFLIHQQGFATCPGSISFTARSGLWDAPSHHAWLAGLTKSNTVKIPVFCRRLDTLLDEARALDVDEFTQTVLAYGRGREAVEDWVAG